MVIDHGNLIRKALSAMAEDALMVIAECKHGIHSLTSQQGRDLPSAKMAA
jgi:hypothetical protein